MLNIPPIQLDYLANLKAIAPLDTLQRRQEVLQQFAQRIQRVLPSRLPESDRVDYELIRYELDLNLQRIEVEKEWLSQRPEHLERAGLRALDYGKTYYTWLLKRWIDLEVTPEELFEFGQQEVARVKKAMASVQQRAEMDTQTFQAHINSDQFFYQTPGEVQQAFEEANDRVAQHLEKDFPYLDLVPEVKIKRNMEVGEIKVPAFYRTGESTFYYNWFDEPFNKRQINWIYIHEALPGHHYQRKVAANLELSPIQQHFRYASYAEGWAAYIEEIGWDIGAYRDIYDELGKWEWDIIRSVRVVLDIGLNYYGWSDEKAMAYWQTHIQGQDDIARREIKRMNNWPAQVITYKYGADQFLKWRKFREKEEGFTVKGFHKEVLRYGDLPLSIMEKLFFRTSIKEYTDIPYLSEPELIKPALQCLNLVLPRAVENPPLFLWVGGGAWARVDRHMEMDFARKMANEGMAVASVGHRLSPAIWVDSTLTEGIQHPKHAEDVAAAFQWLYQHAEEYGYDRDRIYVGGFSSGAHLAAMLAMDERLLDAVGHTPSQIAGVIPVGGAYDISHYHKVFLNSETQQHLAEQHVEAVFGSTEAHFKEASPTEYIAGLKAPMFLISENQSYKYAVLFEEALKEAQVPNLEVLHIEDYGHGDLWKHLSLDRESGYRDQIRDFILAPVEHEEN